MRATLICLLSFCCCALEAATIEGVAEWRISGKMDFPKDAARPLEGDISIRIVRLGKRYHQASHGATKLKLNADGDFSIEPADPNRPLDEILKGTHRLAAFWDGRFSNVIEFKIDASPAVVKDVVLKFGDKGTNAVRFRVVHPETKVPIPGIQMRLKLSPDAFSEPALAKFPVSLITTDENGFAFADRLPEGIVEVTEEMQVWNVARPIGEKLDPWCRLKTLPKDEALALDESKTPVVFRLLGDKEAMYWDTINDDRGENAAEGTVLVFTSTALHRPADTKEPITFKVTVGKDGILKSPIVKPGTYRVSFENGVKYADCMIEGMGTAHLNERTPMAAETKK
jgi:hypothetical protein